MNEIVWETRRWGLTFPLKPIYCKAYRRIRNNPRKQYVFLYVKGVESILGATNIENGEITIYLKNILAERRSLVKVLSTTFLHELAHREFLSRSYPDWEDKYLKCDNWEKILNKLIRCGHG